jgi:hypothetical protein
MKTTQSHAVALSVVFLELERAMGIEPTGAALPELENERFGAMANPKCDGRVNFRGMWGHVGIREPTSVTSAVSSGIVTTPPGDSRPYSSL